MPVATSPYSQNDYQAASNFRPYNLPINAIAQAITAQDKFWDEGAARVKSVYDNALNLQLSIEGNKEVRDKFMQDADKQLTKLSSMDLSDPSVQRQGFNIYKPLFQDEGVVYDDLMTRHYGQVRNDALSYRTKNNGKEYSDTNLAYALDGYGDFVNSKDRKAGKQFYQKRKEYIPYYDYTAEANVALKNCHPDELSRDVESGLNIVTYSDKGLSSAKLNGCLGSISDKAKKQLSIDGYMTYKNNLPALRDAYIPSLQNTQAQLSEEAASWAGILANKNKISSLSEAQLKKLGMTKDVKANPKYMDVKDANEQYFSSLQQKKLSNQLRLDNLNKTINQLNNNDFSSIAGENLESVAGSVYTKGYMDAYSASHSYIAQDEKIKGNPSQMLIYRENRQDMRQDDQQDFQKELKQMELEGQRETQLLKLTLKDGKLGNIDISDRELLHGAFSNADTEKNDYDKMTAQRVQVANDRAILNQKWYYQLKDWGGKDFPISPGDFQAGNATWQSWYTSFTKSLPADDPKWDRIHQYETEKLRLIGIEDVARNAQDQIDVQLKKNAPELYNREFLRNFKSVEGVTPEDMQLAIEGKGNASGIVVKKEPYTTVGSSQGAPIISTGEEQVLYKNGNKLSDDSPLRQMYQKIYSANNINNDKLATKRNELAKTHTILQKEGYSFPEMDIYNEKDPKSFKAGMLQRLGLNGKDADAAITIGETDLRGHLEITIHEPPGAATGNAKWDADAILNEFKNKYAVTGDIIPVEGAGKNKYHFVISVPELDKFAGPELQASDYMTPMVRSLENAVSPAHPVNTGLIRGANPTKLYGIKITSPLIGGGYNYELYTQDGNTVGTYTERIKALAALNKNLETKYAK